MTMVGLGYGEQVEKKKKKGRKERGREGRDGIFKTRKKKRGCNLPSPSPKFTPD